MCAILGDGTFFEDDNGIGIFDGTQSVRDDHHGLRNLLVLENLVESLLDLVFGFGIEGRGCLVEE